MTDALANDSETAADEVGDHPDHAHDNDHDHDHEDRDPEEQVRRLERLRRCLVAVDRAELRRALVGLPTPVLDSVATAVRVKVPVLRAGSPKVLRRLHDPLLLDTVASAVCDDCLEAIRGHLGDDADDPEPQAVRDAVDAVSESDYTPAMVRLTLAMVAAGVAEASDACDELLDTDPRFTPPDEDEVAAPTPATVAPPSARAASDEKKAARKARRLAEAERRREQHETAKAAEAKRRADRKKATATATATAAGSAGAPVEPAPAPAPEPALRPTRSGAPSRRRPPTLLGDDARDFDGEDRLVGSVVIAEIWFIAPDLETPAIEAKRRPCVIVGVSPTEFLVRPGYSEGGRKARDWQSHEVGDWREAGLDKPTWIELEPRRIERAQAEEPPLGRLTPQDWNALW